MNKKLLFCSLALFLASAPLFALSTPSGFNAIAHPGSELVRLSWDEVKSAAGYNVYRREEGRDFARINFSPVSIASLDDQNVIQGKDYEYCVTALNGGESPISIPASAPYLTMKTSTLITHPGDKPVEIKSILTKKMVTMAVPGDIIQYKITLANNGYGKAANTLITYPIPAGTKLIPTSVDPNDFKAEISYYNAKLKQWLSKIEDETSITRIRFKILEALNPRSKGDNGYVSFMVLIGT